MRIVVRAERTGVVPKQLVAQLAGEAIGLGGAGEALIAAVLTGPSALLVEARCACLAEGGGVAGDAGVGAVHAVPAAHEGAWDTDLAGARVVAVQAVGAAGQTRVARRRVRVKPLRALDADGAVGTGNTTALTPLTD